MDFFEVVSKRRSVRKFSEEAGAESVMKCESRTSTKYLISTLGCWLEMLKERKSESLFSQMARLQKEWLCSIKLTWKKS